MAGFAAPLEQLIEQLAALPSVGRKSAQRLAFHILSMSDERAKSFTDSIINARSRIHRCSVCCDLTDGEMCSI